MYSFKSVMPFNSAYYFFERNRSHSCKKCLLFIIKSSLLECYIRYDMMVYDMLYTYYYDAGVTCQSKH